MRRKFENAVNRIRPASGGSGTRNPVYSLIKSSPLKGTDTEAIEYMFAGSGVREDDFRDFFKACDALVNIDKVIMDAEDAIKRPHILLIEKLLKGKEDEATMQKAAFDALSEALRLLSKNVA
jgi:hypothetical protein